MVKKSVFHFNDFHKICHILNTLTKMDVRLLDKEGNALLQLVNHHFPIPLQQFDNEYLHINNTLEKNKTNSYYYYVNSYGLEYVATGIWSNQSFYGCIVIGPFISSTSIIELISDIITINNLPVSQRNQLQEFYKSLSVITSNECRGIGELLVNMCTHQHIQSHLITTKIMKPTINKEQLQASIAESKNIIEMRYQLEKKLMNAISKGDKDDVARFSNETIRIVDFSDRIPESPIRSSKNILLVLNTLCRLAAEKGGVHPIYIDNISEKFAILIERATNINQLKSLGILMLNEYCDVVKVYSTLKFSPIVKKAVDYIQLNLEEPLSLNDIASTIHVNPSHLSRKFKEDTNMNIIEYINHKRVEEAKLYLQRGNTSVTEIAFMVGFNDLNYFSRVFKKATSLTPSKYMKEHHYY